jgi:hypothetical protein
LIFGFFIQKNSWIFIPFVVRNFFLVLSGYMQPKKRTLVDPDPRMSSAPQDTASVEFTGLTGKLVPEQQERCFLRSFCPPSGSGIYEGRGGAWRTPEHVSSSG